MKICIYHPQGDDEEVEEKVSNSKGKNAKNGQK